MTATHVLTATILGKPVTLSSKELPILRALRERTSSDTLTIQELIDITGYKETAVRKGIKHLIDIRAIISIHNTMPWKYRITNNGRAILEQFKASGIQSTTFRTDHY